MSSSSDNNVKHGSKRLKEDGCEEAEATSKRCQTTDGTKFEDELRETIILLLANRNPDSTICPSEVPRHLSNNSAQTWRERMPDTRQAAFALADAEIVEIRQRGRVVDHRSPIRGPLRIGRGKKWGSLGE